MHEVSITISGESWHSPDGVKNKKSIFAMLVSKKKLHDLTQLGSLKVRL